MTLRVSGSGDPAEISRRMLGTDSLEERPDSLCVPSPCDGTCAGRGIALSKKGPFQRALDSAAKPFAPMQWNRKEIRSTIFRRFSRRSEDTLTAAADFIGPDLRLGSTPYFKPEHVDCHGLDADFMMWLSGARLVNR